ncbi:MAG: type II secretion system protein [Planctomycetota bacterium]|jgi:prepilin-type N-terminal cleavage/methylation domain-containing protein
MTRRARGFTIVELLVVISIITILLGLLIPAVGKARAQARLNTSKSNLRNLATAASTYAAAWNDRQFTMVMDGISRYGNSPFAALGGYHLQSGGCNQPHDPGCHPGVILGWGETPAHYNSTDGLIGYWMNLPGNFVVALPINFGSFSGSAYWGAFRIPNARQFNQYVNGRFYDPIFYAPNDRSVREIVGPCLEDPAEFSGVCHGYNNADVPFWSSYCFSPAAMYAPQVFSLVDDGSPFDSGGSGGPGFFTDPWSLEGGLRSPSMSQARYADLKTHVIEHHWLQNPRADCNPAFSGGTYDGCEPYYFNHSWESVPVTMFYDGHVDQLGVREAEAADTRHTVQAGYGLWSRDTPFGAEGYLSDVGYDFAQTSFHILTIDGIRGRDRVSK